MSRPAFVAVLVSVGLFVAQLDLLIVNIAFPELQRDFATDLTSLSWVLNAYAIVFAALLVPFGRWADRAGRKRAFLLGLGVFTVASAVCAAAPSVEVLVGARIAQAAGAAMLMPASLGLLLAVFPVEKRAAAIGLWAAVGGIAAASGPVVGGVLVELSWRWVFLVNIPVGVIAIVLGLRRLPEVRDSAARTPDWAGAALLTAAIAALTTGIVQGPEWGWGGGRVLGLFALALVLGAFVAARSKQHPAPVVEPDLVRRRPFAAANIAAVLFFTAFGAFLLGAVVFLTTVWQQDVLTAGLMIAPGPATAALVAMPGTKIAARVGQRVVGAAGGLFFLAGNVYWIFTFSTEPEFARVLLPAMIIGGIGVGLVNPALTAAVVSILPPERIATGTGVLNMSRQVGLALGVALFVAILGAPAADEVIPAFEDAWIVTMIASGASALAAIAIGPIALPTALRPAEVTA